MAVIFTLCAGNISANRTAFLNNLSDKNVKSGETIEPECFERIMKCNEN